MLCIFWGRVGVKGQLALLVLKFNFSDKQLEQATRKGPAGIKSEFLACTLWFRSFAQSFGRWSVCWGYGPTECTMSWKNNVHIYGALSICRCKSSRWQIHFLDWVSVLCCEQYFSSSIHVDDFHEECVCFCDDFSLVFSGWHWELGCFFFWGGGVGSKSIVTHFKQKIHLQ